jgi:hypothetical protein
MYIPTLVKNGFDTTNFCKQTIAYIHNIACDYFFLPFCMLQKFSITWAYLVASRLRLSRNYFESRDDSLSEVRRNCLHSRMQSELWKFDFKNRVLISYVHACMHMYMQACVRFRKMASQQNDQMKIVTGVARFFMAQ